MAKILIRHKPQLTVKKALEIFRHSFSDLYEVHEGSVLKGPDFIIKKNAFSGVEVHLLQEEGQTAFKIWPTIPSIGARWVMAGIIPAIVLYFTSWRKLLKEVKSFGYAPHF